MLEKVSVLDYKSEYNSFSGMLQACYKPDRHSYNTIGGKGIKVCDRWNKTDPKAFTNFINDLGKRPSDRYQLTRKDLEKDFTPGNCYWKELPVDPRARKNIITEKKTYWDLTKKYPTLICPNWARTNKDGFNNFLKDVGNKPSPEYQISVLDKTKEINSSNVIWKRVSGISNTPEGRIWIQLHQYCYNPNDAGYPQFGAKGIRIHAEWLNTNPYGFEAFLRDVGKRPTDMHKLTRSDLTKDFEPSNVRWVNQLGLSKSVEAKSWTEMRQRCYNPNNNNYKRYGGRGITVCKRWNESFEAFLNDMGNKPSLSYTIDRIDGSKGYEPSNCRWSDKYAQANNQSTNHRVEYKGTTYTIAEISRLTGIPTYIINNKVNKHNLTIEQIIKSTPVDEINKPLEIVVQIGNKQTIFQSITELVSSNNYYVDLCKDLEIYSLQDCYKLLEKLLDNDSDTNADENYNIWITSGKGKLCLFNNLNMK